MTQLSLSEGNVRLIRRPVVLEIMVAAKHAMTGALLGTERKWHESSVRSGRQFPQYANTSSNLFRGASIPSAFWILIQDLVAII